MAKNIIIYDSTIDYKKRESAVVPSSKEDYLTALKSFEGLKIKLANISDYTHPKTNKLIWRDIYFDIEIQRRIEAKQFDEQYREEEVNVDTGYRIHMGSKWKLYDKDKLVYDNDNVSVYPNPTQYAEKFKNATLLQADINSEWTKATFTFDNNLTIETFPHSYGESKKQHFFTIVKDPEPMTKILDFGNPEEILYRNESRNSKVILLDTAK